MPLQSGLQIANLTYAQTNFLAKKLNTRIPSLFAMKKMKAYSTSKLELKIINENNITVLIRY